MGRSERIRKGSKPGNVFACLKPLRGRKNYIIALLIFCLCIVLYLVIFPRHLFKNPTCTVIEDSHERMLSARIAADGQWRFPYNASVPYKFEQCIVQFEDRQFYRHPGFNPFAFGRAVYQNIRAKKIVSGGSTLSMQVIRLSRKNKSRTVFQKLIEIYLASRMELTYTKREILALYASNAPFGSNVVGLDAAAWRYYGVTPSELSWAAMATLAVLPNSPSLIYPGKNQIVLMRKRNR